MGRFVKGQIVVIPFPFTDLSGKKKRPAIVVANLRGDDVILCPVTTQKADAYSINKPIGIISHSKLVELINKIVDIIAFED